jgi:hypothetical protein
MQIGQTLNSQFYKVKEVFTFDFHFCSIAHISLFENSIVVDRLPLLQQKEQSIRPMQYNLKLQSNLIERI